MIRKAWLVHCDIKGCFNSDARIAEGIYEVHVQLFLLGWSHPYNDTLICPDCTKKGKHKTT